MDARSFPKPRQGLLTTLESFPKRLEYRRRRPVKEPNFSLVERPASCDVCGRDSLIPYIVQMSHIIDASRAGCVSCLVICTFLEHFKKSGADATMVYIRLDKSHRPSVEILSDGDMGTERLKLEFFASEKELQHAPQTKTVYHPLPGIFKMLSYSANIKIPLSAGLNMVRSLSGFWDSFKTSRDLVKSYADPSAFKYVSQLLEGCIKSHPLCRSTPDSPLPQRVIDVGLKSQGTDPVEHCRLYCSHGECEKYLTLSHCWGQAGTINTTTRENLEHQYNGIDWSSLSKTFQDAILVTRALGIRYLWIDSLCIIQGDNTDWEQESAKMGSIYEGSYITLAATASLNGPVVFSWSMILRLSTYHFRSLLPLLSGGEMFLWKPLLLKYEECYIINLSARAQPLILLQCELGPTKNDFYHPASSIIPRKNSYGNARRRVSVNVAADGSTLDHLKLNTMRCVAPILQTMESFQVGIL